MRNTASKIFYFTGINIDSMCPFEFDIARTLCFTKESGLGEVG
jgi:hypothetical protein